MYSREETQRLKREFWIAFAEKYPRKWVIISKHLKNRNGKSVRERWLNNLDPEITK